MKFVLAVLILLLVYLFYPFRDLYVKDDPFSDSYNLVSSGLWSQDACVEAADAQQARHYQCRKRSAFARMFRSAGEFGQGHGLGE